MWCKYTTFAIIFTYFYNEAGVLLLFPMQMQETPTQFRIVEVYADEEAYQQHLTTPHFKHYKETTLKMVKSLKLHEVRAVRG